MKKFEVYYCDLSDVIGSEQGGLRPCVIVQNDIGNTYAPTTIIVPCTTKLSKHKLPTHISTIINGIDNCILCEQIRVIDKSRVKSFYKVLDINTQEKVNNALRISLNI